MPSLLPGSLPLSLGFRGRVDGREIVGIYGVEFRKVKKAVRKAYGGKCFVCGAKEKTEIHHIRPLSEGGSNSILNLVLLCSECHAAVHRFYKEHAELPREEAFYLFLSLERRNARASE